jgi:copper(I)-binding protein
MKSLVAVLVALGINMLASAAPAHDYTLAALAIDHPFARATPPGAQVGGAYMTIGNTGTVDDKLLRASSPAAAQVQIHTMSMDGNVMRMREVAGLDVPAGRQVALSPNGYHLMLIDLKKPLAVGERVPMTLTFEHAGTIVVDVAVESMSGTQHPAHRDAR